MIVACGAAADCEAEDAGLREGMIERSGMIGLTVLAERAA
jgi:hypothetical protein